MLAPYFPMTSGGDHRNSTRIVYRFNELIAVIPLVRQHVLSGPPLNEMKGLTKF